MWPNFQNHHGRIFPAQRTARGICPQHVDGLGVKTDEMRVVQSHSHGWAYGWMCHVIDSLISHAHACDLYDATCVCNVGLYHMCYDCVSADK